MATVSPWAWKVGALRRAPTHSARPERRGCHCGTLMEVAKKNPEPGTFSRALHTERPGGKGHKAGPGLPSDSTSEWLVALENF